MQFHVKYVRTNQMADNIQLKYLSINMVILKREMFLKIKINVLIFLKVFNPV